MNKKVLLFSLLLSGCFCSLSAQEDAFNRNLIVDEVEYGEPDKTYNSYKTAWKKNAVRDNWFITIGGGAQMIFGEDDSKAKFGDRITFAPQIAFGKFFSPIWGLRVNFTGGSLHGYNDGNSGTYHKWNSGSKNYMGEGYIGKPGYPGAPGGVELGGSTSILTWDPTWNYMYSPEEIPNYIFLGENGYYWKPNANAVGDPKGGYRDEKGDYYLYTQHLRYFQTNLDFMVDLFNLFGSYNPKRPFTLIPYAGVGLYHVLPHRGTVATTLVGAHAGLISQFRVTDRLGINAEFAGSITPNEFDGQLGGSTNVTGLAQATLGLNFKLNKTSWEVVEPMDYELINKLNDEINRLRNTAPECPECPRIECPDVEVIKTDEIKFLPDPVFFRIDKAVIDPTEWFKIEKAVDYMNKNPHVNVVVTGYADKKTAYPEYNMKLSERRSKAVAQALTQKYGISPLRVSINWAGDQIQPFQINEWNRVVIFVIED